MSPHRSLFLLLLFTLPPTAARAQARDDLADRLATFNYIQDYAGGVAEARANAARLHGDPRARAWYALLLARDDEHRLALAIADSMMRRDSRSPWSWLARTGALGYGFYGDSSEAATSASAEMYRLAPRHPDVVIVRAARLINSGQDSLAIVELDSFLARNPRAARIVVVRANATYNRSFRPANAARKDSALALYARARALDSTDVLAWSSPGARLTSDGRLDEALALHRRAIALAPLSVGVQASYWNTLRRVHVRNMSEARVAALPGIERLLAARGTDPGFLRVLRSEYEQFGMTAEQRGLEERILRDHPWSAAAEWVLVTRYRELRAALGDSANRDTTLRATYRARLQEFLQRPVFINERLRGDAYRELFGLADSTTHPDSLLAHVIGMERYEGINPHLPHARGPIALADRGVHLAEAERLARAGAAAARRRINRASYDGIGEYARALDWMTSLTVDALGWVQFRAGRVEEGERELRRALELDNRNLFALHHLGRLFEATQRADSAESYYIRGAMVATPQANPNRAALRELYRTRHGSVDGYDAYYAGIRDQDRARRRTAVSEELRTARLPTPGFDLTTMGGVRVRSDTLAGRITIINFWGKWCGPCVAEMPELQRFAREAATDSAVRFLTVNNDDNLDELREWMRRHQYDMPVLVDSGYAARASVNLFPTTWFLDRSGRIAFVKAGWSEELAEEFSWRVEILKSEGAVP